MPRPILIILAAGASSRMGRWKPAVLFEGTPIIQRTIEAVLPLPYSIVVVGGHRYELLEQLISPYVTQGVRLVYNPRHSEGFITSVQRGLQEVAGENFFILPGDMPLIPQNVFSSLENSLGIYDMVRPEHNGLPGHPVLCKHKLRQHIMALPAGESLRQGLRNISTCTIPGSWQTVFDVDRPQDLISTEHR